MAKTKIFRLQYQVAYKHGGSYRSPMYKYEVYTAKATSLKEAKAIIKRRHPKATTLKYLKNLSR